MSRQKRLKREKIKATISGLALMIAIGAVGGIGSYAWFSDQAKIENELVVMMGTLDISMDKDLGFTIGNDVVSSRQEFVITNNGSLKESVYIQFKSLYSNGENELTDNDLKQIYCELKMKYKEKDIILSGKEINNVYDLLTMDEAQLIYSGDKSEVILDSEDSISCDLKLFINKNTDKNILTQIQNKNRGFDILVNAKQSEYERGDKNEIKE